MTIRARFPRQKAGSGKSWILDAHRRLRDGDGGAGGEEGFPIDQIATVRAAV
jgi:hypothetical protein